MPSRPANSAAAKPASITYADAGVNISAGDRAKQRIKYLAQRTFNKNVLSDIGGFGGLFRLDIAKFPNPVLVSSADGVGTKLKIAFELGVHHTVGADLVNHCVNDIAVQGATPLFFLDYLAAGTLDATVPYNGNALLGFPPVPENYAANRVRKEGRRRRRRRKTTTDTLSLSRSLSLV